jgi:glycosyltransferase involved in cell wall biosynthesis
MSIVIFGDIFTFPDGGAATNRVFTYAKGFNENGIRTHVICFCNEYLNVSSGVMEGINYYYPFEQKKRNKYFIIRNWKKISKYFKTYSLIKKINKEDKIIAINSWSNFFSTHLFAWFLSRIFRFKLIIECSEHPLRFYQHGILRKMKGAIKVFIESHLCDGIFCISRYLIDFYKKRNISDKKLFLVPSTVDPSRFAKSSERPFSEPYIGYFGSLTFKRDNVDLLIRAFSLFHNCHPDVYLVMGGFCTAIEKKRIADLIAELKIESNVKVLGLLRREEITAYISHADALVMVRGKDLESDASYPSKLTEFLSTGKPVVTVNVGEISDYLSDDVNAFLVEPGNCSEMANKLNDIFNNYDLAAKVGEKGKALTENVFNYDYQSKRMIGFLGTLT